MTWILASSSTSLNFFFTYFHRSLLPTLPTMNVSRKNCPVWLSSWLYHSWDFRLDAFALSQVVGFGACMAADLPSCWPWISRIHLLLTVCIIQLLKADFIELKGQWAMGSNACYTQFLKNSFLVIQFFFYCMKYWCYYYLFILILFFIFFLGFFFFSLFLPLFYYLYCLVIKYDLKFNSKQVLCRQLICFYYFAFMTIKFKDFRWWQ